MFTPVNKVDRTGFGSSVEGSLVFQMTPSPPVGLANDVSMLWQPGGGRKISCVGAASELTFSERNRSSDEIWRRGWIVLINLCICFYSYIRRIQLEIVNKIMTIHDNVPLIFQLCLSTGVEYGDLRRFPRCGGFQDEIQLLLQSFSLF